VPGLTFDPVVAAAAAEVSRDEAKFALDELARLQLLDVDSVGRFKYHDLLRLFAREHLELDEGREATANAIRRSTKSYVRLLTRIAGIVDPEDLPVVPSGEPGQSMSGLMKVSEQDALEQLLSEKDNIVASMSVARQMQFDDLIVELGAAIRPFGLSGFPLAELIELESAAVEAGRRLADDALLARVLFNLGRSYRHRGMAAEALRCLVESFDIARRAGSEALTANIQYFIGHAQRESGHLEEARESYGQALARFGRIGWTTKIAAVKANLGLVEDNRGDLATAEDLLRDAVDGFEQVKLISVLDLREQAWSQQALGGVLMRRGVLAEAGHNIRSALELFEKLKDRQGQVYSLRDLGDLSARNGCLEEAGQYFGRALEISLELGEERGRAQALASLSILAARRGNPLESIRWLTAYAGAFLPLRDRGRARSIVALGGCVLLASIGFRVTPRFPRAHRN
jgi:tetratricopeptide (TPR) repeat protein